jgi:hypothetical protein
MNPFAVATLALFAAAAAAQPDPARAIPAGSFMTLRFAGLGECREGLAQSGVWRLGAAMLERVDAGQRERLVGRQLRGAGDRLRAGLARAGIAPADLHAVLQSPLAVGVGRPTFWGGMPVPSLAAAVAVQGHEPAARRLLAGLQEFLVREGPQIEAATALVGDATLHVLRSRRHSGEIAWAFADGLLLLGNSPRYLGECLAAARAAASAGERQPPLLAAELNVAPLCNAIAPFLPYEADAIARAVGVASLQGVRAATGIDASGAAVDVVEIAFEAPADGVLRAALGRPLSERALRWCPEEALGVVALSFDGDGLIEAGRRLLDVLPREVRAELDRELAGGGDELGMLRQLATVLGPQLTIASTTPMMRSAVPEVVAFLDVRDTARAQAMLTHLLRQAGVPELQTARYRDTAIEYADTGIAAVAPAFVFEQDTLVVGSTVMAVKHAISRMRGEREGLAQNAQFGQVWKTAQGASLFAHLRMRAVLDIAPGALEGGLEWLRAESRGRLPVPTADELAGALHDCTLIGSIGEDGASLRAQGPLGAGLLVAGLGAFLDQALGGEATGQAPPKRRIY